jgi:hypothetical protein
MYCQDVGTYIWKCTNAACGLLACVAKAKHDHGCIDATPDEITNVAPVEASDFKCPQCLREADTPLPVRNNIFVYIANLRVNDNSTRFPVML